MEETRLEVILLSITPNSEELIEKAGRVCYKSKMKTYKKENLFIRNLIKKGHDSVLEHASATFLIKGFSRASSQQLIRHRHNSFSQISQRYVEEDGFKCIVPYSIKETTEALKIYEELIDYSQTAYNKLRNLGIKKEDARMVLTNSTDTEIVTTANFRQWRNVLDLRLAKDAQWEIRKLANYILSILKHHAPNVFYDFKCDIEGMI